MDTDGKREKRQGNYKGSVPGRINNSTSAYNHVFSEAFDLLGEAQGISGVERLVLWAEEENKYGIKSNLKEFYAIFAKRLPRIQHNTTEDLNRTHEAFIELMAMQKQEQLEAKGQPVNLLEVVDTEGKDVKVT